MILGFLYGAQKPKQTLKVSLEFEKKKKEKYLLETQKLYDILQR